ncbi:exported hypothetical protein [Streptomyces misionensis JCM 4497]
MTKTFMTFILSSATCALSSACARPGTGVQDLFPSLSCRFGISRAAAVTTGLLGHGDLPVARDHAFRASQIPDSVLDVSESRDHRGLRRRVSQLKGQYGAARHRVRRRGCAPAGLVLRAAARCVTRPVRRDGSRLVVHQAHAPRSVRRGVRGGRPRRARLRQPRLGRVRGRPRQAPARNRPVGADPGLPARHHLRAEPPGRRPGPDRGVGHQFLRRTRLRRRGDRPAGQSRQRTGAVRQRPRHVRQPRPGAQQGGRTRTFRRRPACAREGGATGHRARRGNRPGTAGGPAHARLARFFHPRTRRTRSDLAERSDPAQHRQLLRLRARTVPPRHHTDTPADDRRPGGRPDRREPGGIGVRNGSRTKEDRLPPRWTLRRIHR